MRRHSSSSSSSSEKRSQAVAQVPAMSERSPREASFSITPEMLILGGLFALSLFALVYANNTPQITYSTHSDACSPSADLLRFCEDVSATDGVNRVDASRTIDRIGGATVEQARNLHHCFGDGDLIDILKAMFEQVSEIGRPFFGTFPCRLSQTFNGTLLVTLVLYGVSEFACVAADRPLQEELFDCTYLGSLVNALKYLGILAVILVPAVIGIEYKWPGTIKSCCGATYNFFCGSSSRSASGGVISVRSVAGLGADGSNTTHSVEHVV